jgi:pimeloyl-ACP methyl ester carboxylesterase
MPRRRRLAIAALALVGAAVAALYRPDLPPEALRARYAPTPPSRFVRVQGMDVHYRDEGRGPTVVLLHGMGASLHTWDGWTAALRDSLRVVRLDLPGYGLTGPFPHGRYDDASYVAFLADFLDAVGIARASLAGNSMGGEIAWRFALARPARVERLVLVDAAGYPYGDPPPLFRLVGAPGVAPLVTRLSPRWMYAANLRQVYTDDARVTDALIDRYYLLTRRAGNREAFLRRALVADSFPFARLRTLRAPTLVLWGADDLWIPRALADTFVAYVPGARAVVYDGVGHLPMEEAPERSAADARRFLLGGG